MWRPDVAFLRRNTLALAIAEALWLWELTRPAVEQHRSDSSTAMADTPVVQGDDAYAGGQGDDVGSVHDSFFADSSLSTPHNKVAG
jgi:hypothetical protein